VPIELQDGQSVSTVDPSVDVSVFRDTSDHVLAAAALNNGINPDLISGHSVDSAEARRLMRMPLDELRKVQQIPFRRFEHALAIVMSVVLRIDLPAMKFDITGWRIQFGEPATALSPLDEQSLYEKRQASGLDNPVAMMQRLHPGLPAEKAVDLLTENQAINSSFAMTAPPIAALRMRRHHSPPKL